MRPYELMTILAPDVPEDELTPAIDTIASYITRFDGTITTFMRDSPWGRRRLSYPIRYQSRDVRDGFYVLWYFEAEPEAIAEIDRELRLNDLIIRHLTIALDKPFVPAPPAPVEAPAEGEAASAVPATEPSEDQAETTPGAEAAVDEAIVEAEATEEAVVEAETAEEAVVEAEAAVEEAVIDAEAPAAVEEAAAVVEDEMEAPAAAVEEAVEAEAEEAPAVEPADKTAE